MKLRLVSIFAFIILPLFPLQFAFATASQSEPKEASATECEALLSSAIESAMADFQKFFSAIEGELFERDFFLKVAKLALLSKEHVLMLGPPGNAKSMGVDLIIDNIVDKDSGATSVFKIQMTPETSLSETHGVIDYKKITEENIQTRKWDQGLLSAKMVFIDEFFDARANSIRNNLMALNEREHAQGRERIKGETETGFAASNKYIHEVYEKAGDDGPKAIIDRFAFVVFVPGELSDIQSALKLIQEGGSKKPGRLTFQDLDILRDKVKDVKIPDYIARMLTLMFSRMKAQTEALEESEKKRFIDQKKSGLTPMPPYRATKYYSPRTLRKAGKILRAIVVNDWIEKRGERALTANSQDLEKLVDFFTLNSLGDEFLTHLEESTVNPYEKIQVMTVLKERGIFHEIYSEMMTGVNSQTANLTELEMEREAAATPELKKLLLEKMVKALMETTMASHSIEQIRDMTESDIAIDYVRETLTAWMQEMLGADFEKTVAAKIRAIERERKEKIESERRLERERLQREAAEAREREVKERKAAQEREERAKHFAELKAAFTDSTKMPVVTQGQTVHGRRILTVTPVDGELEILSGTDAHLFVQRVKTDGSESVDGTATIFTPTDEVKKVTRLEDGRYLFWYGMYGRIYVPGTGFESRKIIHETHDDQIISNNSKNGEVWLVDREEKKIGVMSSSDPMSVTWKAVDPTAWSFGNSKVPQATMEGFMEDFVNQSSSLLLTDEPGEAYLSFEDSRAEAPLLYRLNFRKASIEVVVGVSTESSVSTQAKALFEKGLNVAIPRFEWIHHSDSPDGRVLAEFNTIPMRAKATPLKVAASMEPNFESHLRFNAWTISPDLTYMVILINHTMYGYDLGTGELFSIAAQNAGSMGSLMQVSFVENNHLLLLFQSGYSLLRMPTAGK